MPYKNKADEKKCRDRIAATVDGLNRRRISRRNYNRRLRILCLEKYGNKCACCGEERFEFLSIDHIKGGGGRHRKELTTSGISFHNWLKKNNFPEGFRVLCHNCNTALGHYGYCPHSFSGD